MARDCIAAARIAGGQTVVMDAGPASTARPVAQVSMLVQSGS